MTAPAQVAIVDEDGTVSTVAAGDVAAAKGEGARVATQDEIDRANYRGGLAGAASTADALARGATFGASDKLQVEGARLLGGDEAASQMAQKTRLLKDNFADTTDAAEFAGGFLLPVPGTGLARGVGGAVAKGLAGAAERAVGKGALTFALEHALPGAIQAGFEGGVMGAGSVISEAALGDHDVNAEKLVAGAGKGALFGSVLGGGLGLLGGAGGARVTHAVSEAGQGMERSLARETAPAIEAAVEKASAKAEASAQRKMEQLAEEFAFKETGAKIADWRKLGNTAEKQAERAQGIGRFMLDEGLVVAGQTKEKLAERVGVKVREVGAELGGLREKIYKTGASLDASAFARRVEEEVLAPLAQMPGTGTERKAVGNYLEEFLKLGTSKPKEGPMRLGLDELGDIGGRMAGNDVGAGMSLEKAFDFRKKLDTTLGWDKLGANPATEQLRKVRSILEEEWERSADQASKLVGESGFAEQYALKKDAYSKLKTVEKISSKEAVARANSNRAISLSDYVTGAGAFATMGPAGLLAVGANKLLRTFGDGAAATALNSLTKLEGVQKAAQRFDSMLGRDVGALTGRKAGAIARVSQPRAEAIAKGLLENPEALQARVSAFMGSGLRDVAPRTAEAVGGVATRALTFLASRAPKDRSVVNGAQPRTESREPSRQETMRFSRYVEAIDDPLIVVKGLRSGNVTREHVEAVREVYPRLYAVMQGRLAEEVSKLPKALPYPTRVALSVLFQTPLDASMQPAIIAGIQSQYSQPKSKGLPPTRPLKITSNAPASARLEAGHQ